MVCFNIRKKVIMCFCVFLICLSALTSSGDTNINIEKTAVDSISQETLDFAYEKMKTHSITQKKEKIRALCADTLDWGVDNIEAERVFGGSEDATDIGGDYTGDGIKVAVIDSGIDKLSGSLHHDFTGKIAYEYDFCYGDSSANDNFGHGTHCAGIIGAQDDDDGMIGIAPECELVIAKVMYSDGSMISSTGIATAIDWVVSKNVDVISISWGGYSDIPVIREAFEDAYDAGVVIVAAAGNDDTDIAFPANHSDIISVGAVSSDYIRAGYPDWGWGEDRVSNYGETLDFVAPGTEIWSTYLDNEIERFSGTSMAAPHVAGLCALILEAQPLLTPAQVKDVLKITATDIGTDGKDDYYGWGFINADLAINAAELYFTDTDSDEVYDAHEIYLYETDPYDTDSDDDGLNDYYELHTSLTDPNDDDSEDDGLDDNYELTTSFTDPNDDDSDNDGLTDGEEVNTYGTDPNDDDTDNDSCKDGWEVTYGYDPDDNTDGALDLDNDYLRNIDEHFIGTDPNDADTDDDGIIDGDETYWNLDPLDPDDADDDDDNDGLTNLEEINGWYDFNDDGDYDDAGEKDVYQTKPNDTDTDGDNCSDYKEQHDSIGGPYDPTDPNDHPPTWPG